MSIWCSADRFRLLSERAVRKVKTFVSRPIKDATLQLFVSKIEAKKHAEESGKISEFARNTLDLIDLKRTLSLAEKSLDPYCR
ncbi:hypothetical protein DICVIV_04407 [Dictyocaulus viviparus]|uniref:Uncharacterized protein n=1 Tax=Dictyocaulus viviparus TaxID=29172 RepID=A0A0D8XY96_DICVI|nr:hypothetical protein DICVIV_04407 [Dictyocaulus viviparus]